MEVRSNRILLALFFTDLSEVQPQAKLKLPRVGGGSGLAKAGQRVDAGAKHIVGKLEVRSVQKIETLNQCFLLAD